MFVTPLVYSDTTDWCRQYVTEVQILNPLSTESSIAAPGLHEHMSEDEEWTPVNRSEEITSSPSVTSTPSTTPPFKTLSEEIAHVTTIYVLLQLFP